MYKFYGNVWICARRTNDRDFESQRHEKVNAWMCARPTTHHDLARIFLRVFFELVTSARFFCKVSLLSEVVFELIDIYNCDHFRGHRSFDLKLTSLPPPGLSSLMARGKMVGSVWSSEVEQPALASALSEEVA